MAATEITLVTGARYEVEGSPEEIELTIISAARGSDMQLAWLTDAHSGQPLAVNPQYVVALRAGPDAQ